MSSIIGEAILSALCVIGAICIIKSVYDIILIKSVYKGFDAKLVIMGDSRNTGLERILKTAKRVQNVYFPDLRIVYDDKNDEDNETIWGAEKLTESLEIEYKGKVDG